MEMYGMKFGKNMIARNLNTYRMAYPTEQFWTAWRTNKSEMKNAGWSVFKRGDRFYVAFYDGGKATEEEYKAQQDAEFQQLKKNIISLIPFGECEGTKDEKRAYACEQLIEESDGDFWFLSDYFDNADYVINEAKDLVFSEEIDPVAE